MLNYCKFYNDHSVGNYFVYRFYALYLEEPNIINRHDSHERKFLAEKKIRKKNLYGSEFEVIEFDLK